MERALQKVVKENGAEAPFFAQCIYLVGAEGSARECPLEAHANDDNGITIKTKWANKDKIEWKGEVNVGHWQWVCSEVPEGCPDTLDMPVRAARDGDNKAVVPSGRIGKIVATIFAHVWALVHA